MTQQQLSYEAIEYYSGESGYVFQLYMLLNFIGPEYENLYNKESPLTCRISVSALLDLKPRS